MALPEELLARLAVGPLLLDGGMGSLLLQQGLESGRAPEHWNLEYPERISSIHRAYSDAGCDVVHTNTFGASPPKLAEAGLAGRCAELCTAAARIARSAVKSHVWVAGDLGPTGRMLPPMGDASEAELEEAFAQQAEALAAAGVDLLSIETMYDLREALSALRAARATGLATLASLTFDHKKRGFFTLVGDPLAAALNALAEGGATAVGANCTLDSREMLALVREAVDATELPVLVQPNAGQPRLTPDGIVYDADPESFAQDLAASVRRGVRIVGGCCGTDPRFLRASRLAIDREDDA